MLTSLKAPSPEKGQSIKESFQKVKLFANYNILSGAYEERMHLPIFTESSQSSSISVTVRT